MSNQPGTRRVLRPTPVIILMAVGFLLIVSTHLLPLSFSPFPFNNDGITEARIADDILDSGHLTYPAGSFYTDTHSVITPAYNVMLAFISSAVGSEPVKVAQYVVAVLAVLTIFGCYCLSLALTRSSRAAFLTVLILSLLGTFAFLTASTWKSALGISLWMLLLFAYSRRAERGMIILEMAVLGVLPIVHHLVTVIAYFSIAYLTILSVGESLRNEGSRLGRREIIDISVVAVPSAVAYSYYKLSNLSRLNYFDTGLELMAMSASFLLLLGLAAILFYQRDRRIRFTFAPFVGIACIAVLLWTFFFPIFPYDSGTPDYVVILLISFSVLIAASWYGYERIIRSVNRDKAIPICMVLPVIALFLYSILIGVDLKAHQIFYRTFDFMDVSFGIACAVERAMRSTPS